VNEHFGIKASDRWLIALPLHHVGGFAIFARAHLSGSSVVHDVSRWQPRAFANLCEREKITHVSLVPTQIHDLVRDHVPCPESIRAVIVGGGSLPREMAEGARALGWRVYQSYGMTEAASQIATQTCKGAGTLDDLDALEVLPHWKTHVDDRGCLILSGESLAKGYAIKAKTGIWTWHEMGRQLVTRDVVRLWDHGTKRLLQFIGRESGFVKILGELVHLAPLQARLESLIFNKGFVSNPVIVAVSDARSENRLVLVSEDSYGESIMAAFNDRTERLCHLTEVIHVRQIPRSPLGKVSAEGLRALVAQTATSAARQTPPSPPPAAHVQ
jgi:O-succinylbenzoic acid--CoA ligase